MGGEEKKVLALQKKKKRKNNKKKVPAKPKLPIQPSGQDKANDSKDLNKSIDYELGSPIDFHEEIDLFLFLVMFVALLCKWFASGREANPVLSRPFANRTSHSVESKQGDDCEPLSNSTNVTPSDTESPEPSSNLLNSPEDTSPSTVSSYYSTKSLSNSNLKDIPASEEDAQKEVDHSDGKLSENAVRECEALRQMLFEEFEKDSIIRRDLSSQKNDGQVLNKVEEAASVEHVMNSTSLQFATTSFSVCISPVVQENSASSAKVSQYSDCEAFSSSVSQEWPSSKLVSDDSDMEDEDSSESDLSFADCTTNNNVDVENTTPEEQVPNVAFKKSKTQTFSNNAEARPQQQQFAHSYPEFELPGDVECRASDCSDSAGHRSQASEEEPDQEVLGSDDEEQEDPRDYRKGGYHPVLIGDVFNNKYHVIRKLGWGHFSTVWLCWDTANKRFVAMKIVKSAEHYTEAAIDEIRLLRSVRDEDPADSGREKVVQLLDEFTVSGVNGDHVCMVFEVLGCNLLKLIIRSNYDGLHIEHVRTITRQILEGLRYMHEKCHIIHTDIKPENVLVTMSHDEVKAMAQHAVVATKMNLKLSGSAVSTAPLHVQKKKQENLTKNKKKKLKRKAKKQRELLESQLAQMEGLTVDANAITEVLNSAPNSARGMRPPAPFLLRNAASGQNAALPRLLTQSEAVQNQSFCNQTYYSDSEPTGSLGTKVQEISDAEDGEINGIDIKSPAPIERTSLSPPHNDRENLPDLDNNGFNLNEPPTSPTLPFSFGGSFVPGPPVGPDLNDPFANIEVKIADLGNACWVHHHFTEDIQTRQYRSLEVLIGAGYGPPADIWSTACMVFELATGDYLFEPHQGDNYSRDEDHLAHIHELLGSIPPSVYKKGGRWREFFSKQGKLLHIQNLKPWPLIDVLRQKYEWPFEQARQFASFLVPMLAFDQDERATAAACLQHDFLKPFGGKAPPPNCPSEVLERLYPTGSQWADSPEEKADAEQENSPHPLNLDFGPSTSKDDFVKKETIQLKISNELMQVLLIVLK
ncbi:unnamed protein product [Auanema sp. JU1783]|nr:unnamed protein product [Auanema sp. JU1783]